MKSHLSFFQENSRNVQEFSWGDFLFNLLSISTSGDTVFREEVDREACDLVKWNVMHYLHMARVIL